MIEVTTQNVKPKKFLQIGVDSLKCGTLVVLPVEGPAIKMYSGLVSLVNPENTWNNANILEMKVLGVAKKILVEWE